MTQYGPPNICTPNKLFVLTREKAELQIECAYALFLEKQKSKKESEVEEMTHVPICPHCGQPDEENVWLAKQQDEEYDDTFDCERCGGAYKLRNRGGVYEVEAVEE